MQNNPDNSQKGIRTYEMMKKEQLDRTRVIPQNINHKNPQVSPQKTTNSNIPIPLNVIPIHKSDSQIPLPVQQNLHTTLNDYFHNYQSQNSSMNPSNVHNSQSTRKQTNPLLLNVDHKLLSEKSLYFQPDVLFQNNSPTNFSESIQNKTREFPISSQHNPRIAKFVRKPELNPNNSYFQDKKIIDNISAGLYKTVNNDFPELSSKNMPTLNSIVDGQPNSPVKVSNHKILSNKIPENNQNSKLNFNFSDDQILDSSLKIDRETLMINNSVKQKLPANKIQREVVPDNPYKRNYESILGKMENSMLNSQKQLDISANYAFNSSKKEQEKILKNNQKVNAHDYQKDHLLIPSKKTKFEKLEGKNVQSSQIANGKNKNIKNLTKKGFVRSELTIKSDSVSEILKNIVLLFIKIIDIIFRNFSDFIDKIIKDESSFRSENTNSVVLKLPLGISFSVETNSYETLKKVITFGILFSAYRYLRS